MMSQSPSRRIMLSRQHHRRIRVVLLTLWFVVLAVSIYFFFFQREWAQRELQNAMSTSMLAAGAIYLLVGCLRGFSLLPVTSLLLLGVLFFPPVPLFLLTLVGILFSSASVYWFAEALHLEETFNQRHRRAMDRLTTLLRHREFPIIVIWSFFPLAPTDLICYVCGILKVDFRKCLLGVLLGEGTICAIYIFFGHYFLKSFGLHP